VRAQLKWATVDSPQRVDGMDNVVDGKLIECTAENIAAAEAAARLNQAGSPERLEHLGKIIPWNP